MLYCNYTFKSHLVGAEHLPAVVSHVEDLGPVAHPHEVPAKLTSGGQNDQLTSSGQNDSMAGQKVSRLPIHTRCLPN